MKTNRCSNRYSLGILAPALVIWTFLTLVSGAQAQTATTDLDEGNWGDQSLRVSLWLNKNTDEVYRRGEPLNVTFQTNEDSYAVVYHIDVEGRVSVLWPTSRFNDGFVFGGHQYRLPARGGERMRAGDRQGQGFFHAVVSEYPFDLRDLDLDFHHEEEAVAHDFYVAGDPYLAMNEVNFAVTGLEDSSEFAVSNFVSYYVHRVVDHPRYMCFQCHDGDDGYEPYRDQCTITIQADYTWVDEWWDTWGYFPTYVMPVYVYVDPWTHDYWVNYWYRPWYHWPSWGHHHWHHTCWDWHHSPYWRHDAYVAHGGGHDRYRPLDRSQLGRDRGEARTKNPLVRSGRPADDRIRRMKDREVVADTRSRSDDQRTSDRIRGGGGRIKSERPQREQQRFDDVGRTSRERTSPGLRLDSDRSGRTTIQKPGGSRTGRSATGRAPTRVGKPSTSSRNDDSRITNRPTRRGDSPQTIKPVNPRNSKSSVWSNRRTNGSSTQRPSPPPSSRTGNRQNTQKPKSVDRSRGSSSSRSSSRATTVKPRTSPQRSKPASPPPSRNSGGSSSRSKSSGGSKAKQSAGGRG